MGPNWGAEDVKLEELKIRHDHIECWPSFDAVRQYEWIRVEGKFNMITEYGKVIDEMMKLGFFEAIEWMQLCREKKVFFGIVYSEAYVFFSKSVPSNKWFDKKFILGTRKSRKYYLQEKMQKLQREINDLEDK